MIYSPETLKKKEHFSLFLFFSLNTYETHNLSQGNTHSFYPTDPYPGRPYSGGGGGGVNLSLTAHAEYNETNNEWNDINALEPITAEDFNAVATKAAQAQDTATTADTKADAAQTTASAALPADDFTKEAIENFGFSASATDWSELTGIPADFADGVDNNDAKLTEAEVDAYTANNGYLTTETDPTVNAAAKANLSTCAAGDVLLFGSSGWECSTNVSGTGKWSDGTTSGDIYYTGGNVGIGTTSPDAKLYVIGNNDDAGVATTKAELRERSVFTIAPNASVGSTNMNFGLVGGGDTVGIQTTNSGATADWNIALNPFGGKVGIGTTTPNAKLEVNGEIIQTGSTRRGYTHYQDGSAEKLYHYLGRVESWCGAIGVEGQFESHNTTTRGTGNFDLSFARRDGFKVNGFASGLFGESLDIELYETEEGKATDFGLNLDVYLVTGTYAMTNINISQTPGCGEINTAEITPQEKSETSHDGEEPYYKLSTDGAALFTDVNGNVGIGTTDPSSTLHVHGEEIRSLNGLCDETGQNCLYPRMIEGIQTLQDGLYIERFTIDGTEYMTISDHDSDRVVLYSRAPTETNWSHHHDIAAENPTEVAYFNFNGDHRLAVAEAKGNPDSSGSIEYNITSRIFKWDDWDNDSSTPNTFQDPQDSSEAADTNGALSWEHFVMNNVHYLAVANYNGDYEQGSTTTRDYTADSAIYKWNASGLSEVVTITTEGARHWEHIEYNGEHFLFLATGSENAKLYSFDPTASGSELIEVANIGHKAHDGLFFEMNDTTYLAVSSTYYTVELYTFDGASLTKVQGLSTGSSTFGLTHFSIDDDEYLGVATYGHSSNNYSGPSKLFRWNGSKFVKVQEFNTRYGYDILYDGIDTDGDNEIEEHQLIFAGNGHSTVYRLTPDDTWVALTGDPGAEELTLRDGEIGIGTTSPSTKLHISSGENYPLTIDSGDVNHGTTGIQFSSQDLKQQWGYLSFTHFDDQSYGGHASFHTSSNQPVTNFIHHGGDFYVPDGNVGIGTNGPAANLEISSGNDGDAVLRIESNEDDNSQREDHNPSIQFFQDGALSGMRMGLTEKAGDSYNSFAFFHTAGGTESETPALVIEQDNTIQMQGDVGIGTTSPSTKLHISSAEDYPLTIDSGTVNHGTTGIQFSSQDLKEQWGYLSFSHLDTESSGGDASFHTSSNQSVTNFIHHGGDFYVPDGDVYARGNQLTSDSRYKKDIQTLPSALKNILSLRGVSYYWKDRSDNTEQIGVIAQEVEKIYPQLVHTNEDGYKSVAYSNLVSPLIEAVKELHALYQGHADRIALLEMQNAELRERDAALEEQNVGLLKTVVQLEVRLAALEAAQ